MRIMYMYEGDEETGMLACDEIKRIYHECGMFICGDPEDDEGIGYHGLMAITEAGEKLFFAMSDEHVNLYMNEIFKSGLLDLRAYEAARGKEIDNMEIMGRLMSKVVYE